MREEILQEVIWSFSRSSGAGGQNVNKVNTRAELRFCIEESKYPTDEEKETLRLKLSTRINQEDELILACQTERTQLGNREKLAEKFLTVIEKALKPVRPRKATSIPKSVHEERLKDKRQRSEIKKMRSGNNL